MRKMMVVFYSLLLFLLGAGLRTWNLSMEAPGFEEIANSLAVLVSPGEYIRQAHLNLCPPAYYLMLHPLALFDGHLGLMRLPSILLGALAPVALYLAGRRLFTERAGMLAGFFLVVSPLHVYLSQEAQPIATFLFVLILAFYFFIRSGETNKPSRWAIFDVLAVVLLHLHPEAIFVVGTFLILHLLRVFFFRDKEEQRRLRISRQLGIVLFNYVIIVSVALPWLSIMPTRMPWFEDTPTWRDLLQTLQHHYFFGMLQRMPNTLYAAVLILVMLVMPPVVRLLRQRDARVTMLIAAALLILLLPFGYSYIGRVRFDAVRTGILALPLVILILALLLSKCNFYVRATLFALYTSLFLFATFRQALSPQKTPYDTITRTVKEMAKPSDLVVFWPDYTSAIGKYFFGKDQETLSATEFFKERGDPTAEQNVYFVLSQMPSREAHLNTFPGALKQYANSEIVWRDRLNMLVKTSNLNMLNLKLWYDEPRTLSVLDVATPNVTQFIFTTADPVFRNEQFYFKEPDICYEMDGRRVIWTNTRHTDLSLTVTLAPGNYVLKLHCSPDLELPEHNLTFDRRVHLDFRTGEKGKRVPVENETTVHVPFDTDVEIKSLPIHLEVTPMLELTYPRRMTLGLKIYSISIDLETPSP